MMTNRLKFVFINLIEIDSVCVCIVFNEHIFIFVYYTLLEYNFVFIAFKKINCTNL